MDLTVELGVASLIVSVSVGLAFGHQVYFSFLVGFGLVSLKLLLEFPLKMECKFLLRLKLDWEFPLRLVL